MNHKSAGAEDATAPTTLDEQEKPKRYIVTPSQTNSSQPDSTPREILIVASKLKDYVKTKHDLNTSANVMEKLTLVVMRAADEAAQKAKSEGRKTLMDRDF